MKVVSLLGLALLPLAASAQKLTATAPPISYHVGLTKAPLFLSAADTARKPSDYLPSQAEAVVVGRFSPRWVVVNSEGFLYLTPVAKLSDYDPADAEPLPIDPNTQLIAYEGVVLVPGATKAELYARAHAWITRTYNLANATFQQQSPEAGELALQGQRPANLRIMYAGVLRNSYAGVVHHTLIIYVKDGRYKYVLSNLTHDAGGVSSLKSGGPLEQNTANLYGFASLGNHKAWADMKVEATRDARHLMRELQEAMTLQKPKAAKDPRDF